MMFMNTNMAVLQCGDHPGPLVLRSEVEIKLSTIKDVQPLIRVTVSQECGSTSTKLIISKILAQSQGYKFLIAH